MTADRRFPPPRSIEERPESLFVVPGRDRPRAVLAVAATKTAQQSQNERTPKQGGSRSKQSHVIAMLRSPAGATDRRDDERPRVGSSTRCGAFWPEWCASALT